MVRSLRIKAGALLGLAALGIAACGSSRSDTTSSSSARPGSPGAPAPVLRLGYIGGLTGPSAAVGTSIENGEQLAVSRYDVDNPAVRVVIDAYDTRGAPAGAVAAATRLIEDRVVAVIGPTTSGESAAADPLFEAASIPNLTASAAADQLARNGWSYFHRVIANDSDQGSADADYLVKTLGQEAVAVLDDSSAAGAARADEVRVILARDGGRDVLDESIPPATVSDAPTVDRIIHARAQAVFFSGSAAAAGRLVEQLRLAGYRGVFMSDVAAGAAQFVAAAGAAAEGAYLSYPCPDETQNGSPAAQVFTTAYRAAFGTAPGPYAAEAYDATDFVLAAIKSGFTTPWAINDYLDTNSYAGLTKSIKFLPDGDLSGAPTYIYEVKDQKIVQVGAAT